METITKYAVKEVLWPGKTFVTKRTKTGFDKLGTFFSESYGALYEAIKKLGIKTNEPPCAIYYSVDEAKSETDLAASFSFSFSFPFSFPFCIRVGLMDTKIF